MIIVNVYGGLGNQMFQYATAYALSRATQQDLKLDTQRFKKDALRDFELSCFTLETVRATQEEVTSLRTYEESLFEKLLRKLKGTKKTLAASYIKEKFYHFDETLLSVKSECYLDGYWQSEKYFSMYREEILKQFTAKNNLHNDSQVYIEKMQNTPSVSLHIRRGDYVSNPDANSFHGLCSLAYYKSAVEEMNRQIPNAHYFIFSDDLVWAKENLTFIDQISFVDLGEDVPDYEEIILMSQCEHNVIANSSFSWWGAWLGEIERRVVIAPKQWFNDSSVNTEDLIPSRWIRL